MSPKTAKIEYTGKCSTLTVLRCVFFFRFLGHFIDECEKIVSPKLKFAKENAKKSQADFEEALSKVSDLEKVWEEVKMK